MGSLQLVSGLKAWRLSKRRYATAAITGEGARLLGGRWNSPGVPVVYASLSLSLAVLEVFVHMSARAEPDDYVSVMLRLPIEEHKLERVDLESLPSDWRRLDHPRLQALGDTWAGSMRSVALLIPSVVVQGEWNVIINPLHPDAKNLLMEEPQPFSFDERMFTSRA